MKPVREPVPQFGHRTSIRALPHRIRARIRRASTRASERPVEQRPQLGPVTHVRVVRDPGLHRGPQLSPIRHFTTHFNSPRP